MLDRRHETLKGDREVFTGHDIVQGQVPSLGEDPVKFLGICVKNSSWILLKDPWALCLGLDFKKKKYLEFQCLECLPPHSWRIEDVHDPPLRPPRHWILKEQAVPVQGRLLHAQEVIFGVDLVEDPMQESPNIPPEAHRETLHQTLPVFLGDLQDHFYTEDFDRLGWVFKGGVVLLDLRGEGLGLLWAIRVQNSLASSLEYRSWIFRAMARTTTKIKEA